MCSTSEYQWQKTKHRKTKLYWNTYFVGNCNFFFRFVNFNLNLKKWKKKQTKKKLKFGINQIIDLIYEVEHWYTMKLVVMSKLSIYNVHTHVNWLAKERINRQSGDAIFTVCNLKCKLPQQIRSSLTDRMSVMPTESHLHKIKQSGQHVNHHRRSIFRTKQSTKRVLVFVWSKQCDIILMNTCTWTHKGERKNGSEWMLIVVSQGDKRK